MIKEFQKVKLRTGEKAHICDVLEQGVAYMADIIEPGGDYRTEFIRHEDIACLIVEVEAPLPQAV